jgi:hypothetical protein
MRHPGADEFRKPRKASSTATTPSNKLARLDGDHDGPAERPVFDWCLPRRRPGRENRDAELAALCVGVSVAFLLDDRVIVGTVERAGSGLLIVKLWGRDRPTRVAPATVRSLRVVGPHTRAEEKIVRDRQRSGDWLNWSELRGRPRRRRE